MELWIIRHAQAEPATRGGSDFARPLSDMGRIHCARLAAWLVHHGCRADRIIASDAMRTRETATALAVAFGIDTTAITLDHRVYHANAEQILEVLRETPEAVRTLVVIGHNPAVSTLASGLSGGAVRNDLTPLGAVALRPSSTSWVDLDFGAGTTLTHVDPATI